MELEVRCYNALMGACLEAERYEECLDVVRHLQVGKALTQMAPLNRAVYIDFCLKHREIFMHIC